MTNLMTNLENWSTSIVGNCLVSKDLVTGECIPWPIEGTAKTKRMFVRPCYRDIWKECQELFTKYSREGVFVVGTPGIGKSCFLAYALHELLNGDEAVAFHKVFNTAAADEGTTRAVLYLDGPGKRGIIYRSDGVIETLLEQLYVVNEGTRDRGDKKSKPMSVMDVLAIGIAKEVDFILYDPPEEASLSDVPTSRFHGKPFIVAVSPDRKNCKKMRKDTRNKTSLYMGTYSLEEAKQLRLCCYANDVTEQLVIQRYAVMGGIARHLFAPLENGKDLALKDVEVLQVEALNTVFKDPTKIDAHAVPSKFKHLWSIFHLKPVETSYNECTVELCNDDDIRAKLIERLMRFDVDKLWSLYFYTNQPEGTLRGLRYEAFAHNKILAYGIDNREATSLGEGASITVKIPKKLPPFFLENNSLLDTFDETISEARARENGAYVRPITSNFPVIDSMFIAPEPSEDLKSVLLQMKAGGSSVLPHNDATTIHEKNIGPLVFVVPDETIMRKRLDGGPAGMLQYRLVLRGDH